MYGYRNKVKPYKLKENNEIELLGMVIGTLTMYTGFIFAKDKDSVDTFYVIATVLIFVGNAYFMLKWIYLLLVAFDWKNRHYQTFVRVVGVLLFTKYHTLTYTQTTKSKSEYSSKKNISKVSRVKRKKLSKLKKSSKKIKRINGT